jgi:hypothetical protein
MDGRRALLPGCAIVLGAVFTAAGCGGQTTTGASGSGATGSGATTAAATVSASPAATSTATPGSGTPGSATPGSGASSPGMPACASRSLTITLADNNKSLCVTVGTAIAAFLRGTPGDEWSVIHSDSAALVPKADPRMMLQAGVTGAAFEAVRPGFAVVSSVRYPCQRAAGTGAAASPPAMDCGTANAFRVTLNIQSR